MPGRDFFDEIRLTNASNLGIVGGVVIALLSQHTVAAEAGPDDELDTVWKGSTGVSPAQGDLLMLRLSGANPVILTGAGNIRTPGGRRMVLAATTDHVVLRGNGTNWDVVGCKFDSAQPRTEASDATASTTITNPAVETAFDNTHLVRRNTLGVGGRARIRAVVRKAATAGADASTYRIRIGGVTLLVSAGADTVNDRWVAEVEIGIRAGGAGGTFVSSGVGTILPAAGGAPAALGDITGNVLVAQALDLSADATIDVTVTRTVNDAGNQSVLEDLSVVYL